MNGDSALLWLNIIRIPTKINMIIIGVNHHAFLTFRKSQSSFIKDLLKFVKKHKVNVAISAHGNSMRPFRQYFEKFNNKQMMKLYNAYDAVYEFKVKI